MDVTFKSMIELVYVTNNNNVNLNIYDEWKFNNFDEFVNAILNLSNSMINKIKDKNKKVMVYNIYIFVHTKLFL